jgi:hypothetical protein
MGKAELQAIPLGRDKLGDWQQQALISKLQIPNKNE